MSLFTVKGGFSDIVASSRVRLARNISGYRYGRQSPETLRELTDKVWDALQSAPAIAGEFERREIVPRTAEAQRLVEAHTISPALAQNGGYAIVSKDGGVSLMIGEEDHLRLQVMGAGLCPKECLAEAQRLAGLIESRLPMDFDERLGYLTACPTNLGTGLRVSVMLHLPMLTATGGIPNVLSWAGRQGCALRGAYGEGSEAAGGFYQLSNQVTLGMSEEMLCGRLVDMAAQLIEAEQKTRQAARERDEIGLADQLCRAAGVLGSARRISTEEAERCLSSVLMGLQMKFLSGVEPQAVCAAERDIRPASLTVRAGRDLSPAERDALRADYLRETVGCKLTVKNPEKE